MGTDALSQVAPDNIEPDSGSDEWHEQELRAKPYALIDPALSHRAPNISAGANINLNSYCRALITAIRSTQRPARNYGAVRICAIVMWEDQDPLPGQPEYLKHGVSTLPARQIAVNGDTLRVWTVPNEVIGAAYLDDPTRIIWHAIVALRLYADLAYPDFRSELVGVYEDQIHGRPGLVVAVLMLGNLWCKSFMNTTAIERGMDGLFKREVESMLEDQFDPPILRSCILDAFAKLE